MCVLPQLNEIHLLNTDHCSVSTVEVIMASKEDCKDITFYCTNTAERKAMNCLVIAYLTDSFLALYHACYQLCNAYIMFHFRIHFALKYTTSLLHFEYKTMQICLVFNLLFLNVY